MSTIWIAVITVAVIALVAGALLAFASARLPAGEGDLADLVNKELPQTQCAQCGYPGCLPYARAIADSGEAINLCPPGGQDTVRRLAELLGREETPLAGTTPQRRTVAVVNEALCIGCTHCRNACPVDAIVGASHFMHTVLESECTGCELCLAPCPVDCISMRPAA